MIVWRDEIINVSVYGKSKLKLLWDFKDYEGLHDGSAILNYIISPLVCNSRCSFYAVLMIFGAKQK